MRISQSRPKSLSSNAVWNITPVVLLTVINFLLTPFIIRSIGTDDYGLYMILVSIGGMMGIMNFGLGEATMRYVAYYYGRNDLDGINRVLGSTLSVYSISSIGICLIIALLAPTLIGIFSISADKCELGIQLLRITAINFALISIYSVFVSVTRALQRYDYYAKITIVQNIFQMIGTVIVIILGYGIFGLVSWIAITSLFTLFLSAMVARRLIPRIRLRPSMSREGIKEVSGYGLFSMISQVMGMLHANADRLILGSLINPAAVAYLAVPNNLALRVNSAVLSGGSALFPRFSAMEDPAETKRLFFDSMWLFLCATIVLFVPITILLPDFLRLWISRDFAMKSAWVGQILAFICIFRGAFIPHEFYFRGVGKPQYISIILFISGGGTLLANLFLIPKLGLAGAGYCYAIDIFVGFGAIAFSCRRLFAMESFRPLVRIILLPLLIGLAGIGGGVFVRNRFLEVGWTGLILLGISFALILVIAIVAVEYLASKDSPRIKFLLNIVQRLFPSLRVSSDKSVVVGKLPPIIEK